MPSWPGARSAWAIAVGDVTRKVVRDVPLVDGSVLPSQNATSKGRSGSARASSSRSGAGREKAMPATYRVADHSPRPGGCRRRPAARARDRSGADVVGEVLAGERAAPGDQLGRRALKDDAAAVVAGARPEVDDPVG